MRKHAAAEMGKSGQIRDTKPKRDKCASLENCDFFLDTSLKIGTVPENPVPMVTVTYNVLILGHIDCYLFSFRFRFCFFIH